MLQNRTDQEKTHCSRPAAAACFYTAAALLFFFMGSPAPCSAKEVPDKDKNYEQSAADLRKRLSGQPESQRISQALSALLTEWAVSLYESKQNGKAIHKLNEAVQIDPSNGPALFFLGDLMYLEHSDFSKAEYYWKKALPHAPADKRRAIIERISRAGIDNTLERQYRSTETAHFSIRHSEGFDAMEVQRVGDYLEGLYKSLAQELSFKPGKLTLIIYPDRSFGRLSGDEEILGLYDGRIRFPESQVNTAYEKVILNHELAHAFLHHRFGNDLPIWIQEGYAQAKEPARQQNAAEKKVLKELYAGNLAVPLQYLDRRFLKPVSDEQLSAAYLQARLSVEYLLKRTGPDEFFSFLSMLSAGEDLEKAFKSSFKSLEWTRFSQGQGLDWSAAD